MILFSAYSKSDFRHPPLLQPLGDNAVTAIVVLNNL